MVQDGEVVNARLQIERINAAYYENSDLSRSLAHWALQCLLADVSPEDDALRAATAIGGAHDLGIDAYWVDEDNSRLIFIQAKDTKRLNRPQRINTDVVQSFRQAIETLTNENYIRENANESFREAYYEEISELLYDESYSIYAVVAAGGRVSAGSQARSYSRGPGSSPWHIHDESSYYSKEFEMEVLDIIELTGEARQLRSGLGSNIVDLPVVRNEEGSAFHLTGGHHKSALATVQAKFLADIYREYRSGIFQYNPRGPQASNKVNTEIERTINDPTLSALFHMLNNGITIVCRYFLYDEERSQMAIADLQIVNGCQTVYTLHKLATSLTDEIMVNIRIVEGLQTYASEIAKASNSQTAVRADQLVSLEAVHNEIARILDEHDPPWYYEKQLGGIRFLPQRERSNHIARYGRGKERTVGTSELGKWATAFLGYPIVAKHNKKAMFEKQGDEMAALYNMIFTSSNSADQVLLPILLGRAVQRAGKNRVAELRLRSDAPDDERDWLPYAYHHIVSLIGAELGGFETQPRLLSRETSTNLLNTMDAWFGPAFYRALDSVGYYVDIDKETHIFGIRRFFRNQNYYDGMKRKMSQLRSRA